MLNRIGKAARLLATGNLPMSAGYGVAEDRDVGRHVTWAGGTKTTAAPRLRSANSQVIRQKPQIDANVIDLAQNNGFIAGAIEGAVQSMVGTGNRLNAAPVWQAVPGGTKAWADDVTETIERAWSLFTAGTSIDWHGQATWSGLQAQAARSFFLHGEVLAVVTRTGRGRFKTKLLLLDPSQLRTPDQNPDGRVIDGIEHDEQGRVVAYHIASEPKGETVPTRKDTGRITRFAKYNNTGRQVVFHLFDPLRPKQARGVSPIAAVACSAKRLEDYLDAVLVAAEEQTGITQVIKADVDQSGALAMMGQTGPVPGATPEQVAALGHDHAQQLAMAMQIGQEQRIAIYSGQDALRSNAGSHRTSTQFLAPGDDFEIVQPANQAEQVDTYSAVMLSEIGRAFGMSIEQISGDYRQTSYSSARMSSRSHHAAMMAVRSRFLIPLLDGVYRAFLDELAMAQPIVPRGADFDQDIDALAACEWLAPTAFEADPLKAAKATESAIENRTTTLAEIYSAKGMDWRDALAQQAAEQAEISRLGLKDPKAQKQEISTDDLDEPNEN